MKFKEVILSVLFVFTAVVCGFAQNPKREVVFTLNANEVIYANEYYLLQTFNQNKFACMIKNTLTKKLIFVFNGKRIKEFDSEGYDARFGDGLHSFNLTKDHAYILTYKENDKWYIDYNGTIDGGFEDIYIENHNFSCNKTYKNFSEKDYDYLYGLAGRWYAHKNGENKKINFIEAYQENGKWYTNANGTLSNGYNEVIGWHMKLTKNGKYAYVYTENKSRYANINGNISKPYKDVGSITITESGKYAYLYEENENIYANINGNMSKPYKYIWELNYTENGKYAYLYKENEKYYANINGNTSGGFALIYNLILTENGKYAYLYEENEKRYVNINGNTSGGFANIQDLRLTESGKYAYFYEENGRWYININGNISEDFDNYDNVTLTESGRYVYSYKKNGKKHINNNDNITSNNTLSYNRLDNDNNVSCWGTDGDVLELNSNNDGHSFYSSYEYEYVVIDGRPYGKSPAIQAEYDNKKNAFIWTAIESKELVVYEYKLD